MQCPLHNQKVNKPSFHGASCQLAPFNSQTIWTSKCSTYQQHCSGSECSLWGIKMTTFPKLVEFSFIPYMSASVIESRSIGSCSRSGLCAGLMITGFHFQLLLTLLPSIFKNLCWSLKLIFKAKVKLESGNQKIQYGRQAICTSRKWSSVCSAHKRDKCISGC